MDKSIFTAPEGMKVEISIGQAPWDCIVRINDVAVCCSFIRFTIDPKTGVQALTLDIPRMDGTRDTDSVTLRSSDEWTPTVLGGQLYTTDMMEYQRSLFLEVNP